MLIIYHRQRISDTEPLAHFTEVLRPYGKVHLETAADGAALEVLPTLLDRVGMGDCLVVWSLERIGRNLAQVVANLHQLFTAGASVFVACPDGRGFMGHNGRTTPMELIHHLHLANTCFKRDAAHRGIQNARESGQQLGRPAKLTEADVVLAEQMRADGMTLDQIAQLFEVHRETVRRRLSDEPPGNR